MADPYIYVPGDPRCDHASVEYSVLTVSPPISQWTCKKCGRVVRRQQEVAPPPMMPEVPSTFDAAAYPWAKMRIEGDWLYRTDYLHGEDEEIPEEFTINDEIYRTYLDHRWDQVLYELEMGLRYNLKTGTAELISVENVKLERPVKLK